MLSNDSIFYKLIASPNVSFNYAENEDGLIDQNVVGDLIKSRLSRQHTVHTTTYDLLHVFLGYPEFLHNTECSVVVYMDQNTTNDYDYDRIIKVSNEFPEARFEVVLYHQQSPLFLSACMQAPVRIISGGGDIDSVTTHLLQHNTLISGYTVYTPKNKSDTDTKNTISDRLMTHEARELHTTTDIDEFMSSGGKFKVAELYNSDSSEVLKFIAMVSKHTLDNRTDGKVSILCNHNYNEVNTELTQIYELKFSIQSDKVGVSTDVATWMNSFSFTNEVIGLDHLTDVLSSLPDKIEFVPGYNLSINEKYVEQAATYFKDMVDVVIGDIGNIKEVTFQHTTQSNHSAPFTCRIDIHPTDTCT